MDVSDNTVFSAISETRTFSAKSLRSLSEAAFDMYVAGSLLESSFAMCSSLPKYAEATIAFSLTLALLNSSSLTLPLSVEKLLIPLRSNSDIIEGLTNSTLFGTTTEV